MAVGIGMALAPNTIPSWAAKMVARKAQRQVALALGKQTRRAKTKE
jgi:hypothetical protein